MNRFGSHSLSLAASSTRGGMSDIWRIAAPEQCTASSPNTQPLGTRLPYYKVSIFPIDGFAAEKYGTQRGSSRENPRWYNAMAEAYYAIILCHLLRDGGLGRHSGRTLPLPYAMTQDD